VAIWDVESRRIVDRLSVHTDGVESIEFSRDGRYLLSVGHSDFVHLWEVANKTTKGTYLPDSGFGLEVMEQATISQDGRFIAAISGLNELFLWDRKSAELVLAKELPGLGASTIAFTQDASAVLVGGIGGKLELLSTRDGSVLREIVAHDPWTNRIICRPEHGVWITAGEDGTVKLWDLSTLEPVKTLVGHTGGVLSVDLSADGNLLVTASDDGSVRVWDRWTGEERCTLWWLDEGCWAAVAPSGRFDASSFGRDAPIHWVVANEVISPQQLHERYYTPGLLGAVLRGEALEPVEGLDSLDLHPRLELSAPAHSPSHVTARLHERGGGIGRVQVFVNGIEVTGDARGSAVVTRTADGVMEFDFDLADALPLIPGVENTIRVVPWNEDGYMSGRGAVLVLRAPGEASGEPTELWAIVAGVSDYAGSETGLDLRYAAKDAADFAHALDIGARRLLPGEGRVHVRLLVADEGGGVTKDQLREAFDWASEARPQDVFVLYLAGHGTTVPGASGDYAFLTSDARSLSGEALLDPVVRERQALTSTEIVEALREKIQANKRVVVLDTCHSGRAREDLMAARAERDRRIEALVRLHELAGFHILMGSAEDRVSFEAPWFGQGLLTYALLEGMRGPGLHGDSLVDVHHLFGYAAKRVPQLARQVGREQRPEVASVEGESFYIGRLTPIDRQEIPLAMPRPVLLRPRAMDRDRGFDSLGVEERLGETLWFELSGRHGRGVEYVDAGEMLGGIRPSVQYAVADGVVTGTIHLIGDGSELYRENCEGAEDAIDVWVETLAERIIAAAAEQEVPELTGSPPPSNRESEEQ